MYNINIYDKVRVLGIRRNILKKVSFSFIQMGFRMFFFWFCFWENVFPISCVAPLVSLYFATKPESL